MRILKICDYSQKTFTWPENQPKHKFLDPYFQPFLRDDLGLFCLYLRYFPSYQLGSLSILKLRLWGFWKYVIFPEKHWPGLRTSQNKKSSRKPGFSRVTEKNQKISVKIKIFQKTVCRFELSTKKYVDWKKKCGGKYGNGREFAGYPLEFYVVANIGLLTYDKGSETIL